MAAFAVAVCTGCYTDLWTESAPAKTPLSKQISSVPAETVHDFIAADTLNFTAKPEPAQAPTSLSPSSSAQQPAVLPPSPALPEADDLFKASIPYSNENRGPLDFSLHVLGPGNGPTLFVVGGIQGDEPGAFSAASLLVTHYEITRGRLIVVPNLNFQSIIMRDRGPNGDMNRKFAALSKSDPEYEIVTNIKNLLLLPEVDAILNMHDGSGFYRPDWEDSMRNPKRWGQSVIIDQATIGVPNFGNLQGIAETVLTRTNACLLEPEHRYYLKNTHTAMGDREMERALTYFAISNGKPAFGVEASKSFSLPVRIYYHVHVLEAFMEHMGIDFRRKFKATPEGMALALGSDLEIHFPDNQLTVLLDDLRPYINYFPAKKGEEIRFKTSSPLITVVPSPKNPRHHIVYYGNRPVSQLRPDYMEFDHSLTGVEVEIDGTLRKVSWGEVVHSHDWIKVTSMPGYRVNAIGVQSSPGKSECNRPLKRRDFESRYSIDKTASLFRVEVYRRNEADMPDSFTGMFLVRYPVNTAQSPKPLLPGFVGKETLLGY
ncbi:MAG: deacylase [Desulfovibrionaceae bacterium]|nr:deacylase [Desulfovibrionaceae bacterium]